MSVLLKPNQIINGIFTSTKAKNFHIFNKILCELQIQRKNNNYIANTKVDDIRIILNDPNVSSPLKIMEYLNKHFREETITWKQPSGEITSVGLINELTLSADRSMFEIEISKSIVDYIYNYDKLKTGYTPINLEKRSKNYFASRIHELIRKWSGKKTELIMNYLEFKELLGLKDKYKKFRDFKRNILEPVKVELKNTYGMEFDYDVIFEKRRIVQIKLMFKDNEPRLYDFYNSIEVEFEEVDTDSNLDDIQRVLKECNIKIAVSTTEKWKRKYADKMIIEGIYILYDKIKQEKVKAPVSYLNGILINLYDKLKEAEYNESNRFNNFKSRAYDYAILEDKLLNGLEENETADEVLKKATKYN